MKPFSGEVDFVKECMWAGVEVFKAVQLSAQTTVRRVEELAGDVRSTLQKQCQSTCCFSIALDESTDSKDTAQLTIFFRGGNEDFALFEEFVGLVPLSGTTTGADVCNAVTSWMDSFALDLSRLCGVTTDGAPAMIGSKKGFSTLLVNHLRSLGHKQDVKRFHCIVHQEALCANSVTIASVMNVVVKAVNYVVAHALNHRQFRELLDEAAAEYGDLAYFCQALPRCLPTLR
jgi:hypothetical protein